MARKSKYHTNVEPFLDVIERWYSQGLSEKNICKRLDVNQDTWVNYKKKFPELTERLTRARHKRFLILSDALEDSAIGGFREEIKQEVVTVDEKGRKIKLVKHKRYISPNTGAIKSMLKRMDPEIWDDDYIEVQKGLIEDMDLDQFMTDINSLEKKIVEDIGDIFTIDEINKNRNPK